MKKNHLYTYHKRHLIRSRTNHHFPVLVVVNIQPQTSSTFLHLWQSTSLWFYRSSCQPNEMNPKCTHSVLPSEGHPTSGNHLAMMYGLDRHNGCTPRQQHSLDTPSSRWGWGSGYHTTPWEARLYPVISLDRYLNLWARYNTWCRRNCSLGTAHFSYYKSLLLTLSILRSTQVWGHTLPEYTMTLEGHNECLRSTELPFIERWGPLVPVTPARIRCACLGPQPPAGQILWDKLHDNFFFSDYIRCTYVCVGVFLCVWTRLQGQGGASGCVPWSVNGCGG